jgi:3-oxoisoapionate decarboxylase
VTPSAIGVSTYAFLWRSSDRVEHPLTLHDILDATHANGCTVLQICDFAPFDELSTDGLTALSRHAHDLSIQLELGTRGISPDHLLRYLDMASLLEVTTVRSMLNTATHRPSEAEAVESLRRAVPRYAERGVSLALETYEQVPSNQLVRVIEAVDSQALGVCLDPANCVAGLELPDDVVATTAPYVKNWHVKDFAFTRQAGWVGFNLVGCPLGEGLLDYDSIRKAVDPETNNINRIVEHWLPWQQDAATTCAMEAQWTQHSINYLRSKS